MRHIKVYSVIATVILALSLTLPALAAPAPFYKWQSRLNGSIICRQTNPGSGWQLFSTIRYRDAGCRRPY